MKQLLIRADDIGYSYAVNLGIARSVNEGLVRSVGVMPNMPETARGWSWVADSDIAVGQHTNVCLGRPCADPVRVSSLLGPDECFRSSREYRTSWKEGVDFVGQAVSIDGRSKLAAPLCRGKLQVVRRSYRAA